MTVLKLEPATTPGASGTLDPAGLWAGLEPLATDRCIVCRFDADWNGEVIGEDRVSAATDSFPWPALHRP